MRCHKCCEQLDPYWVKVQQSKQRAILCPKCAGEHLSRNLLADFREEVRDAGRSHSVGASKDIG